MAKDLLSEYQKGLFKVVLTHAQKEVNEKLVAPKRKEIRVVTRSPLAIKPAFWIKKFRFQCWRLIWIMFHIRRCQRDPGTGRWPVIPPPPTTFTTGWVRLDKFHRTGAFFRIKSTVFIAVELFDNGSFLVSGSGRTSSR